MVLSDLLLLILIIPLTRNFLSRDLYVSMLQVPLSGFLLYILLATGIRENLTGFAGVIVLAYKALIFYFALSAFNFVNSVIHLMIRRSKNGFVRLDKVFELHVFKTKSDYQFASRVAKALRMAREKEYLIEFTTDHYTHGQLISKYGDGVVSIKPAHPFTIFGNEFYKIVFRVKRNNRRHYLTTVIDPSMIHLGRRTREE